MNRLTYPARNLTRRVWRTILTLSAIALVVLIFCTIKTVDVAFMAAADDAMADRLATRHKVSLTMQLPKRYIDNVRAVPGVTKATWANWFDAKDPKERLPFFAGFAVDHNSWFDVFDDMIVEPAILEEWKQTPNGVILGDKLAGTLGVKAGDKLMITSGIYTSGEAPDWEFKVIGLYLPNRRTVDRNSLILRWDFLNNDPRAAMTKDQIGWVMTRIAGSTSSAEASRAIDKMFDDRDDQTVTMSEQAFNLSFIGAFGAVLTAFDVVAIVILLIMTLILANTIAMSVRERTHEYGVLRAIGFSSGTVFRFILGEALLLAALGGLIGLGMVFVLINMLAGPAIESSAMASMLPYFRTPPVVMAKAFGLVMGLGLVAGVIPAYLATRNRVTDALRRVG
ncbi:MAG: ABC transporter permease [Kofleriaceae bacterium]